MTAAAAGGLHPGPAIPLCGWADRQLAALRDLTRSSELGDLSAATLLGERAALNGYAVPGRISAGGSCRLYPAADGDIALNLARPDDRELLPALFGDGALDPADDAGIAARLAQSASRTIVARGRELGLALAAASERPASPTCALVTQGTTGEHNAGRMLVVDLSALWAGPLAGNLLALAGAQVVKVESSSRPDAMRHGDPLLFARLNAGKDSLMLEPRDAIDRAALLALLRGADIVIEAARPRALRQLGIDADALVREIPGLVWVTITGHGVAGEAANWIGFGDDCGVAGGLSTALREATGEIGFVGDAIADPLTGLAAARAALEQRRRGSGARLVLAMSAVTAQALASERQRDAAALIRSLRAWRGARGKAFAPVASRPAAPVRSLGADNAKWLSARVTC